ncbi:MAG: winged helix-turn-helix domain-containing protein [Xanthomonadales bacterium]|nr:winged helix-turn-helix domain-containing protein [Xanthomonadales bacterium]
MNEGKKIWQTAGLVVDINTGEVSDIDGFQRVRLSPVNLRVLKILVEHAEYAISRQQIFDAVWPNQTISDDALTRCISDLRAQLQPLTAHSLIETIPKVGYRWLQPIENTEIKAIKQNTNPPTSKLLNKVKLTAGSLLLVIFLAWTLLGLIQRATKPISVPVVILHTQTYENSKFNPESIPNELKQAVSKHKDFQYLSHIALQSHQGSPFPYFSHQFGVRWFIESQLTNVGENTTLTLNLVDAKTALVTYSDQRMVKSFDEIKTMCNEFIIYISEL